MRSSWILPVFLGFAIATLSACDSPSPRMMSGERHQAVVGGTAFTVFRSGDSVEVYRTTAQMMPRRSVVFARAEQAIRQTTGCGVEDGSMVGDAALMRALLDCG